MTSVYVSSLKGELKGKPGEDVDLELAMHKDISERKTNASLPAPHSCEG